MDYPQVILPTTLIAPLKPLISQEKMGIRFINERAFMNSGLIIIEESFSAMSDIEKAQTLFLLRECARSKCVLPAYTKDLSAPIPLLAFTPKSVAHFKVFAQSCIDQGLALPAIEVDKDQPNECILQIYKTFIELEYRGPLFLYSAQEPNTAQKAAGLINSGPIDTIKLNDFSTSGQTLETYSRALDTLRDRQWFRVRILPQSAPWMHLGFEF